MNVSVIPFRDVGAERFRRIFEETFDEPAPLQMPLDCDAFLSACDTAGALLAWMTVTVNDGHSCYVSYGGTTKIARGQKLASGMFKQGFAILESKGFEWLHIITKRTNVRMQTLALKTGFLISGVVSGKDGTVDVMFHKCLKESV